MRAYGEIEKRVKYVLEDFQFSVNGMAKEGRANARRQLKKAARQASRRSLKKILKEVS